MAINGTKVMRLKDGKILYDDLRGRIENAESPVKDVMVDGVSVVSNGIANVPSMIVPTFTRNPQGEWSCDMEWSDVFDACSNGLCQGAIYVISNGYGTLKGYLPLVQFDDEMVFVTFFDVQQVGYSDAPTSRMTEIRYESGDYITYSILDMETNGAICNTYYSSLIFPVSEGSYCWYQGVLYKAITDIEQYESWSSNNWTQVNIASELQEKYTKPSTGIPASDLASGVIPTIPVQDVQTNGVSILSNGVANIPKAGNENGALGVVRGSTTYGVGVNPNTGDLTLIGASSHDAHNGQNLHLAVVPAMQEYATFYGLAKAAGADMKDVYDATLGTYPAAQKAAIKTMLGVTDPTVNDVQINGTSILSSGVANIPLASSNAPGVVYSGSLLPNVTSSDNDKVLKVVSGAWTAATAPSGLPAVTSADNGKVLMVVDGQWAAVSLSQASGVSF